MGNLGEQPERAWRKDRLMGLLKHSLAWLLSCLRVGVAV